MSATRRGFFGALVALVSFFQTRATEAQQQTISATPGDTDDNYWLIVYRCPQGHEAIANTPKKDFDAAIASRDEDDPSKPATFGRYCRECADLWLAKKFPPMEYDSYRPVPPDPTYRRKGIDSEPALLTSVQTSAQDR